MLTHPPLALYVHLPWCVRKCPYCDFNSHTAKADTPFNAYVEALLRDLEHDLPLVWGRVVHSVFFGGGTPSLFPPAAIDRFLQGAAARLRFAPDVEITLETNPGTVEHGPFAQYRSIGINRLSLGIQSFDDGCLQRLGRIHSGTDAERAIQAAQDAGLDNLNLDLMYALPGQSVAMAEADITRAIALSPTHISHYQLTLEPNTTFASRPPADLPDDDTAWTMQELCQQHLAQAGYVQYEISAYARPGWQCRHNLNYWQFGDYLGIGAGAHGKLTLAAEQRILRRWKVRHPDLYLKHAGSPAAIAGEEELSHSRRLFDFMLNALRLNAGVPLTLFEARTGLPRATLADRLDLACRRGWLKPDPDWIRPTPLGLQFANDVIALFLDE